MTPEQALEILGNLAANANGYSLKGALNVAEALKVQAAANQRLKAYEEASAKGESQEPEK